MDKLKSFREKQTEETKKYYYKLKMDYPKLYEQAVFNADCIAINHKLSTKVAADIERQFIMFALETVTATLTD